MVSAALNAAHAEAVLVPAQLKKATIGLAIYIPHLTSDLT